MSDNNPVLIAFVLSATLVMLVLAWRLWRDKQ